MSKIIFLISLFIVYVHSGPVSKDQKAEIIKYEYKPSIGGSGYRFEYETSDHQSKVEDGIVTNGTLRVNGTYSYIDTDGGTHTIRYQSDEHGFSSKNLDVPAVVPNREAKNLVEVNAKTAPIDTTTKATVTIPVSTAVPTSVAATTKAATTTAASTTPAATTKVATTAAATTTAATTTAATTTAATTTAATTTAATTTKTTNTTPVSPLPTVISP